MTDEVAQHLGWLTAYAEAINEDNWRDMKLRIERQLEELKVTLKVAR